MLLALVKIAMQDLDLAQIGMRLRQAEPIT